METRSKRRALLRALELSLVPTVETTVPVAGTSSQKPTKKRKVEGNNVPSSYSEMEGHKKGSEDNPAPLDLSMRRAERVPMSPFGRMVPPMENPVILSTLFSHCPISLLATMRLVCKQWYDESLSIWRASFPTTFRRKRNGEIFCRNGTSLGEFLDYVENPDNKCVSKPVRNIKLNEWVFLFNITRRFWSTVGDNLTTLTIRYCRFIDVEEFQQIVYNRCPNLQSLVLKVHWRRLPSLPLQELDELQYTEPIYGIREKVKSLSVKICFCRREGSFPISWLELLSHFQCVTSLEVIVRSSAFKFPEFEMAKLLTAIKIIREQNRQALQLKKLDLYPDVVISSDEVTLRKFVLIRELQLPLQTIRITIYPTEIDNEKVRDVLEFHKETLKEITVDQGNFDLFCLYWDVPCNFELPNVEQLTVHRAKFRSVDFLQYIPNLKKLSFRFYENVTRVTVEAEMFRDSTLSEVAAVRLLRLKELEFGYYLSDDELKIMCQTMPNLEKLDICLRAGQLPFVFKHLRKLRELKVHSFKLTDKDITGIRFEDPEPRGMRKAVRSNITDLQGLEKFAFDYGTLTERSVYHGFLKLPKLKELRATIQPIKMGVRGMSRLLDRGVKILLRKKAMDLDDVSKYLETYIMYQEIEDTETSEEEYYCECDVRYGYVADGEGDDTDDSETDTNKYKRLLSRSKRGRI